MKSLTCSLILIYLLTGFFFQAKAQEKWSPDHVYYGKGGKLTYTPDEQGNIIPDFSHVGYRYGDEPIPDVFIATEVSPVDGDDGASIQAAIDYVESRSPDANGFRGAVLLKKGTYQVSGQLTIEESGVVLRGEGQTDEGTVIIASGKGQRSLVVIGNGARLNVDAASKVAVKEDYVPVGRKFVLVTNASSFKQGDPIALYRPGTKNWISDLKMDRISNPDGTTNQWTASSYSFYFERLVTKVNSDTIFFRNPVIMAMDSKYGGGFVYKASFNRLQNVGLEDLCFKSEYASETDEDHSWRAIEFNSVENGWARRITSWYFAFSCVSLERNSRLISVLDCHCREPKSIITGGRRYSFHLTGSLNLFKGCTTTEGRHDYATSSRVCGPNVFTQCKASNTHSDIGPHHRWAMGTLYDRITSDGEINVQDRDNMGTGHGWAGANQVFWGCTGSTSICQSPWVSALNYNFGFIGNKSYGARNGRPDGVWIGHNNPGIFPASLYETQRDERMQGTRIFSVLPQLIRVNDTVYLIRFNLPLAPEQVKKDSFEVAGTFLLEKDEFSVSQYDDYSVLIFSGTFKKYPILSEITVKAKALISQDGSPLFGLSAASYRIPDNRPLIFGRGKAIDNIDGYGEAYSNKPGVIYMVEYDANATHLMELDSLVETNLGRKTPAPEPDVYYSIDAKGLPGGYYQYYAVDDTNLVSIPSNEWVIVSELGPVSGEDDPVSGLKDHSGEDGFTVFKQGQQLMIWPEDKAEYSIEIYSLTGQLIYLDQNLSGRLTVHLKRNKGALIIKKTTGNKRSVSKFL